MKEIGKLFVPDRREPDRLKKNRIEAEKRRVVFEICTGGWKTHEVEDKRTSNVRGYIVGTDRFFGKRGWERLYPHSKVWYFWGAGWNFKCMSTTGYLIEPPDQEGEKRGASCLRVRSELPLEGPLREFARTRHRNGERWIGLYGGWPARFRPERKPEDVPWLREREPAIFRLGYPGTYPWSYKLEESKDGWDERIWDRPIIESD